MSSFFSTSDIQAAKHKQFLFSMALFQELSESFYMDLTSIMTTKSNLHKLLIQKNQKPCQQVKSQAVQAWLLQKGLKKSALLKKIVQQGKIKQKKIAQNQKDIELDFQKFQAYDIERYVTSQIQHKIQGITLKIMKKPNLSTQLIRKAERKFKQNILQLKSNNQNQNNQMRFLSIKTKNSKKRQMYVQAIKLYGNQSLSSGQLVHYFNRYMDKKFWKIMSRHINCIDENDGPVQKMVSLYLESLKLIQQQFAAELPSDSESLKQYLSAKFLTKIQNLHSFYLKDKHYGSLWGTVYLYYRAGLVQRLTSLIPCDPFLNILLTCQQSIHNKHPTTDHYYQNQSDIFKKQLIRTIKGEAHWQDGLGEDKMGYVWVAIRNLGVFYQTRQREVKQITQIILQHYKTQMLNPQVFYYCQFLLAYEHLAIERTDQLIDQDDYIHFLICLAQNPILCDQNLQKINVTLKKQLTAFIRQLINQQNPNYIYYLTLYPQKYQAQEIAFILASSNKIICFDWSYLKNNIEQKRFKQILQTTVSKYELLTNYSLEACDLYYNVLGSITKAIQSLLKHVYKHYSPSKQSSYLQRLKYYTNSSPNLHKQYSPSLKFLIAQSKLPSHLSPKHNTFLLSVINQYSPQYSHISLQHNKLFGNLISLFDDGLVIYFRFLRNLLRAFDIVLENDLQWNRNQKDRKRVYKEMLQHLLLIVSFDHYKQYKDCLEYKQLVSHIHQSAHSIQYY